MEGKRNRKKVLDLLEAAPQISFSAALVSLILGLGNRTCRVHLQTLEDRGLVKAFKETKVLRNRYRVNLIRYRAASAPVNLDYADPD